MSHPFVKPALRILTAGALFALVWTALTFLEFHDNRVLGYRQLVKHHSVAIAHATSTHCNDHGRVNYAFEIQGKAFVGETAWLKQPCSSVSPGFEFPVNYNSLDPTINSTMEPEEAYSHYVQQFCFMVFFVSSVVFSIMRRIFRKRPN